MPKEPKLLPVTNPKLSSRPDRTILVRVRKKGKTYVASPKRIRVPKGHCTNVVFVLENAPENARLLKMDLKEAKRSQRAQSNPFSLPGKLRVMLLTDDNSKDQNQHRRFAYRLLVREGKKKPIEVDPGIDNLPPPG